MKSHFADWQAFLRWLDSRGMFHMRLGLDRMEKALSQLGLENPPFGICQVLGTNGKGSTCAFLSALLTAAGVRTGLYTSPHFLSPRERIRIDGACSTERDWLDCANRLAGACADWRDLTYFEFITLLALLVFQANGVQAAIMEAGLGGRNDATSAMPAQWQCFTPIAMDHRAVIGPGIREIAADKASAMKEGSKVFASPQFPLAREILEKEARKKHCLPKFCGPCRLPAPRRLSGGHQAYNMGLALCCARAMWKDLGTGPLSPGRIAETLAAVFLPGRRQSIPRSQEHCRLLLDGGHNPHAIMNLVAGLPEEPRAIAFACMADKDWRPSLFMLAKRWPEAAFLLPALETARAESNSVLAQWINERWPGRAVVYDGKESMRLALAHGREKFGEGLCLVTGSFFLLAEVYRLYPQYLLGGN